MNIAETNRLILRQLTTEDAPFILELVNEPSWLRFIGDRGVRTLEDAHQYIINGPLASYQKHGFGLYLAELKESQTPIGMCGLIKRDSLEDVDIGYALRPAFWGQGYASEAATAVMNLAKHTFGLKRIVAITSQDNDSSIRVLEKLGLQFVELIRLSPDDTEEIKLFARNL